MRGQANTQQPRRGGARRRRGDGDAAPIGSITGQPAQVQVSCRQFICVQLGFIWTPAVAANITTIVPPPTRRERRAIVAALFGPGLLAPLQLPAAVDVQPCLFGCACVGVTWGAWTPNPIPQTVTKDVELLQAGQPPKPFTVTLVIPARLRQGIGRCQ